MEDIKEVMMLIICFFLIAFIIIFLYYSLEIIPNYLERVATLDTKEKFLYEEVIERFAVVHTYNSSIYNCVNYSKDLAFILEIHSNTLQNIYSVYSFKDPWKYTIVLH